MFSKGQRLDLEGGYGVAGATWREGSACASLAWGRGGGIDNWEASLHVAVTLRISACSLPLKRDHVERSLGDICFAHTTSEPPNSMWAKEKGLGSQPEDSSTSGRGAVWVDWPVAKELFRFP